MKKMFCREILSLAFLALLFLQAPAQQKALKIGDAIPEEVWKTPLQVVNSPQKNMTLGSAKEKLILLDFWATWCAACLKNFPKMNALEKQFEGKVKIVPVTKEDPTVLAKFFASKNGQRYKGIESVAGDRMFSELFPHVAIPFMVWIKEGKVISTTDADQVTALNISKLLAGETSSLQTVVQIDRTRPLMLAEQFDLEKETALMNYALLSKGRIRAVAPGTGFHRKEGVVYGRQFTNLPLLKIYEGIARELFNEKGAHFSRSRLINRVRTDASKNVPPLDSAEHLYSFEFIVPFSESYSLYPEMLKSLNRFSGYNGSIEILRQKCLIVKMMPQTEQNPPKENRKKETATHSLAAVLADINSASIATLPIINESGYGGDVHFDISTVKDMESLRKVFNDAGFALTQEERDLTVLVITDSASTTDNTQKK